MNLENYTEKIGKKVIQEIKSDSFFKLKCFQKFVYLIDELGFDSVKTMNHGKESELSFFKTKENINIEVRITYEMGTLPDCMIFLENKPLIKIEADKVGYPVHNKINNIILKDFVSSKDYINEIGKAWEDNFSGISTELNLCIRSLADKVRLNLEKTKLT
ncbi:MULTISPECIES: hypothetical protein [Leptospira]|uniref:hypothetical protein n=1 Tax=Leptospira TaxID=171 RepID=UPI0002926DB3|nr:MULTISPECIES: hypothetical protein [Leptospira]EKO87541.1 hypothetical protein LEP1GSC009_2781 [Leptospira interrogans serovar Grippotyphosa str. Andaman]EKP85993.1 hypothetical protein LEP1GSC020_0590 [Leptospira interrogans serovar Grippotyphosa str. 2006006986]EMN52139.1 hypothetical protein LEP1GSC089_0050 [Leptospira interrogans serovar Autumnalis str. LP101]EMN94170.1 hypothetical protein LEP1GSC110_1498 [Leptospira interrogans serovar Medanensis str. UT053]EMN97849.1 hypothetical pro